MLESALFSIYLCAWLFAGVYAAERFLGHKVPNGPWVMALWLIGGVLALFPAVGVWWFIARGLA